MLQWLSGKALGEKSSSFCFPKMVWVQTQVEATIFFQFFLPPTYVNFYSSFLQIKQLSLIPNLAQVGKTLSKSYKYKIL
jgi:hypothetical protein